MLTPSRPPRMRRQAHDMSALEPMRVFHCPMCGSGAVTARSDGTIECGYCTTVFTVKVHPNMPAMPQTVEGQPYQPGDPQEMVEDQVVEGEENAEMLMDESAGNVDDDVEDERRVVSLRTARRMGLQIRRLD